MRCIKDLTEIKCLGYRTLVKHVSHILDFLRMEMVTEREALRHNTACKHQVHVLDATRVEQSADLEAFRERYPGEHTTAATCIDRNLQTSTLEFTVVKFQNLFSIPVLGRHKTDRIVENPVLVARTFLKPFIIWYTNPVLEPHTLGVIVDIDKVGIFFIYKVVTTEYFLAFDFFFSSYH